MATDDTPDARLSQLPPNLPRPEDDGAAAHLPGVRLPDVALPSTGGGDVRLSELAGTIVLYCYPMTGVPGVALPDGWDLIPGARGCTAEACSFRDHFAGLRAAGATDVYGISAQPPTEQREAVERLHLPFPLLSDQALTLAHALRLPAFTAGGRTLLKRLTLIARHQQIVRVFYPVFPPDRHAGDVIAWLAAERP